MDQKISVIGLGKLGATMLACFAHKGWQVIGLDINESNVKMIQEGKSPIEEPYVEEMINKNRDRITATTDYETAVLNSDVSFIIVPTPSKDDGSFSTEYVENAALAIADVLAKKESYHLIVITSTVLPGDSLRITYDLHKNSGKEMGKDFDIVYNPDFIALGKIVYDFFNPDMIIIGESDKKAGDIIENIHLNLVDNKPSIHRMSLFNAELVKISLNAYCTLKITFANIIAEICEKLPGGDASKVLSAIGSDTRVGNKYFRGGLGYSGPCLLPNALVQTEKGLKEIQDIEIGDKVFTHKGRLREVTEVYRSEYAGDMVKITSMGFPYCPIITTPDHPVWGAKRLESATSLRKLEFIPANEIEQGDLTSLPILDIKEIPKESEAIWIEEGNMLSTVRSVVNFPYEGYVHNIEVKEDNSYMLESGVVHNCFPRDNRALAYTAGLFNTTNYYCKMTDMINNYHKTDRICDLLLGYMKEKRTEKLAILGLSYKEDTPIIEESVAISVIKILLEKGMSIRVYDPAAMKETEKELGNNCDVVYASSEYHCVENTAVCFIATPWDQFKNLDPQKMMKGMKKDSIILDAWGILSDHIVDSMKGCIEVRQIGKNYLS